MILPGMVMLYNVEPEFKKQRLAWPCQNGRSGPKCERQIANAVHDAESFRIDLDSFKKR